MTLLDGCYDRVVVLQCNIDDMTGEELGFALERILSEGALDAWFTPIYMKKNRPAVVLSVLCRAGEAPEFRNLLLRETSTLGVRWQAMEREIAERRLERVDTPWGAVRCKVKLLAGHVVSAKPEFQDCADLARQHDLPLRHVMKVAERAIGKSMSDWPPETGEES
ncbi:MAG: nickel insertion protein [Chloroflexota bacterium]|nr:nickel insertion protein [Chloroflexota bacterium]